MADSTASFFSVYLKEKIMKFCPFVLGFRFCSEISVVMKNFLGSWPVV